MRSAWWNRCHQRGIERKRREVNPMAEEFVAVPETVRMDWFLYDGEVSAENRMHFKHIGGAYTDTEADTLASNLFAWCVEHVMPSLGGDVFLQFVIGLQLETEFGAVYDFHPTEPVQGGMDDGLPACVCARIEFKTGLEGKWYNGRNYLPWIPRSQVSHSHINPDWLETLRTNYTTLIADANSWGWDWVVPSRRFSGLPRAVGITTPITSVVIPDNRIRTWRQRIARFGT